MAIGADNWSFGAVPHEDDKLAFSVNQLLAAEYGVHVLENILCDELTEDDVDEFLFVLGHAKFRGTTQMQINPVAVR